MGNPGNLELIVVTNFDIDPFVVNSQDGDAFFAAFALRPTLQVEARISSPLQPVELAAFTQQDDIINT